MRRSRWLLIILACIFVVLLCVAIAVIVVHVSYPRSQFGWSANAGSVPTYLTA
jgi:hypothetical protein